jgi:hypothetical protein
MPEQIHYHDAPKCPPHPLTITNPKRCNKSPLSTDNEFDCAPQDGSSQYVCRHLVP